MKYRLYETEKKQWFCNTYFPWPHLLIYLLGYFYFAFQSSVSYTTPLRLIGWGGAVNQELVDQWWRLSPPWFTWNSNRNIWESKRRTCKQERKEQQQKHTKKLNMSRKCQSTQTEKHNQGKHDFMSKLDNFFIRISVLCNMILKVFTFLIYAYYISIRDHCLLFWKNLLSIFLFCAIYFYFPFSILVYFQLFFYPWTQCVWRENNPI